jgi:hypothetical protein
MDIPILQRLKTFLHLDFAEQARVEIDREEELVARGVASRFTRGSVGIQRDMFVTKKQLDRELT